MKIGELAKHLQVSTDTLRYYESHGLLAPSGRTANGYRMYDNAQLLQMRFIIRAKQVGFSLSEIKELLAIKIQKQQRSCEEVKRLTEQKRDLVKAKIAELQRFERSLSILVNKCCGGKESAVECSILTTLEEVDEFTN